MVYISYDSDGEIRDIALEGDSFTIVEVHWDKDSTTYQSDMSYSETHRYVKFVVKTDAGEKTDVKLDLGIKKWKYNHDNTPFLMFFGIVGKFESYICSTWDSETTSVDCNKIEEMEKWIEQKSHYIVDILTKKYEESIKFNKMNKDF